MHGGLKIYSGTPAAARHYVEADRGRADDYYLAEGTGVARRFAAGEGRVVELAPLSGDAYETWVAGRDPDADQPRGQLRRDAHAVRIVEVVVNGPKTWSLAAALHPDVAKAYEAAQDRAAEQIVGLAPSAPQDPGRPARPAGQGSRRWGRRRCGTTRPGPRTRTRLCTSSSCRGCSRRGNGQACTPSTSGTRRTGSRVRSDARL